MTDRCYNGCRQKWTIKKTCSCGRIVKYCDGCATKYQCNFCDTLPCVNCWSYEACDDCSCIGAGFCYECGEKKFETINCRMCGKKIK